MTFHNNSSVPGMNLYSTVAEWSVPELASLYFYLNLVYNCSSSFWFVFKLWKVDQWSPQLLHLNHLFLSLVLSSISVHHLSPHLWKSISTAVTAQLFQMYAPWGSLYIPRPTLTSSKLLDYWKHSASSCEYLASLSILASHPSCHHSLLFSWCLSFLIMLWHINCPVAWSKRCLPTSHEIDTYFWSFIIHYSKNTFRFVVSHTLLQRKMNPMEGSMTLSMSALSKTSTTSEEEER